MREQTQTFAQPLEERELAKVGCRPIALGSRLATAMSASSAGEFSSSTTVRSVGGVVAHHIGDQVDISEFVVCLVKELLRGLCGQDRDEPLAGRLLVGHASAERFGGAEPACRSKGSRLRASR